MDYDLAFPDASGRRWRIVGAKDVSRHPGHGPWRATTVLAARLVPEGSDAGADGGSLVISPVDVGRLLLSIGSVTDGEVSRVARWWTVARFAVFFARNAGAALLRRRVR